MGIREAMSTSEASPAAMNLKAFVDEIEDAMRDDNVGWCGLEKATTLASLIFGLRPRVVVELGVWMGGSAIPMAVALRHIGAGQLLAVDAWSAEASIEGQKDAHLKWWSEMGEGGHRHAFDMFLRRIKYHEIPSERIAVRRQRTDEAEVPTSIDMLHHDANHCPQVVADIERWAPPIRVGGILIFDDLDWAGGHVAKARDRALELGFVELYPLGTGCVMQRVRVPDDQLKGL